MPIMSYTNAAGKEVTLIRKGNAPMIQDFEDWDLNKVWSLQELKKEGWSESEFPIHLDIDEKKAEEQTASMFVSPPHMLTSLTFGSTLRNQTESPLLKLPGELRNEIYKYIFTTEGTARWPIDVDMSDIQVDDLYGRSQYGSPLSFIALKQQSSGLLAASRQLRHEGAPLLLSEVQIPENCYPIQQLFDHCTGRELSGIRHVYVVLSCSDFRMDNGWDGDFLTWSKHSRWPRIFNRCTGLQEITIEWLNDDEHDEDLDFDVIYALVEEDFRSDKHDPNMAITWYW